MNLSKWAVIHRLHSRWKAAALTSMIECYNKSYHWSHSWWMLVQNLQWYVQFQLFHRINSTPSKCETNSPKRNCLSLNQGLVNLPLISQSGNYTSDAVLPKQLWWKPHFCSCCVGPKTPWTLNVIFHCHVHCGQGCFLFLQSYFFSWKSIPSLSQQSDT